MVDSKLDSGISFVMQSASEAAAADVRAYWDNTAKKFILASIGRVAGIKQFVSYSALEEADYDTSTMGAPLLYAGTDTWVWDYAESSAPTPVGAHEACCQPYSRQQYPHDGNASGQY